MATEEAPRADSPAEQALNFGLMTDGAIMFLGRAVCLTGERDFEEGKSDEDEIFVQKLYVGAMTRLLEQAPGRAKAILKHLALSDDGWDEHAAVICTPVLEPPPFPLARDIVVYAQRARDVGHEGDVVELAMGISDEIRDMVTPDQAAELEAAKNVVWQDRLTPVPVPPGLVT